MRITDVEALLLRQPEVDASRADGSQDALLIRVHTDEGIVGIGESDSLPQVVKAIIDAPPSHKIASGLRALLVGEDPLAISRLWRRMYEGTIYFGRRGAVIHAHQRRRDRALGHRRQGSGRGRRWRRCTPVSGLLEPPRRAARTFGARARCPTRPARPAGACRSQSRRRRSRRPPSRAAPTTGARRGLDKRDPERTHGIPSSRPYGSPARNQAGNGYQTPANTPTSGRPIAIETKNTKPHSALRTSGCAR